MIELLSETDAKAVSRQYTGLTRKRLRLSVTDIQELLETDFPGIRVTELREFPIGGPNELYHVCPSDSHQHLVLKIVNKGAESHYDSYMCAREVFALKKAFASCLKVPFVHSIHLQNERLNRSYFVMECLEGQPLRMDLGKLLPEEVRKIGREVGEAIADLHTIRFDHHGDLPIPNQAVPMPHYKPIIWGLSGNLKDVLIQRTNFVLNLYRQRGIISSLDCKTLRGIFHRKIEELLGLEAPPFLVQTDIDPKNILISKKQSGWHFVGLVDFDRSLALPPEAELGVMENRWQMGASNERKEMYHHFRAGFFEGYKPDVKLSEGWEDRMELFCLLESLERISYREARSNLSRYIG